MYCRLLGTIDDPVRRMKWQQIQGEVAEVRNISTFSSFARKSLPGLHINIHLFVEINKNKFALKIDKFFP
jgi:hypothetical protein